MKLLHAFFSLLFLINLTMLEEVNGWRETNFAEPPKPLRQVDHNIENSESIVSNSVSNGHLNSNNRRPNRTNINNTQVAQYNGLSEYKFNLTFDYEELIKTMPQDPQTLLQYRNIVYQLLEGLMQASKNYPQLVNIFTTQNHISLEEFNSIINELFKKASNDTNFIGYFISLSNYFSVYKISTFDCRNITSNILQFATFVNKQWNSVYNILKPYLTNLELLKKLFITIDEFLQIENIQARISQLLLANNIALYEKFCNRNSEINFSLYMHNFTVFVIKIVDSADILLSFDLLTKTYSRYSSRSVPAKVEKRFTLCNATVPLYDTNCTIPNCERGFKIKETLYIYSPDNEIKKYWAPYNGLESNINNLDPQSIRDKFFFLVNFNLPNLIAGMVFTEAYYTAEIYFENGQLANLYQTNWKLKSVY